VRAAMPAAPGVAQDGNALSASSARCGAPGAKLHAGTASINDYWDPSRIAYCSSHCGSDGTCQF